MDFQGVLYKNDFHITLLNKREGDVMHKKILILLGISLLFVFGCSNKKSLLTEKSAIKYLPTQSHPGNLSLDKVPQFISFGFDDNGYSGLPNSGGDGGIQWILDLMKDKKNPDGSGCKVSFYCVSKFITDNEFEDNKFVKESWRKAFDEGHEIGLHTHSHPHGAKIDGGKSPTLWNNLMKKEDWDKEISLNIEWFTKKYDKRLPDSLCGIGLQRSDIVGFRTPYLEFNNGTLASVAGLNIKYDCSIEEGWQEKQDGKNFYWPYQLDNGSPVATATFLKNFTGREKVDKIPGLWEIPAYVVFVPTDEVCEKYGLKKGFRERLHNRVDYFDATTGKITGFDWNLWFEFTLSGKEFTAILKYTLDLKLQGNKAPFAFGVHSDIYHSKYDTYNMDGQKTVTDYKERQKAVEEFIKYAQTKNVYITTASKILKWMENPKPLN